ncbi:hypothetical protein LTR36_009125, partial [Oleoguttula mirabilis]
YKNIYVEYKKVEKLYEALPVHGEDVTVEQRRKKLELGKETVRLRNVVNRRFFSQSAEIRGHVRWILKLEAEVQALEDELRTLECPIPSIHDHAESPVATGASTAQEAAPTPVRQLYRSLLSPEVPMSALAHLPDDHPAFALKQFISMFTEEYIARLYAIVPCLDDSADANINASECGPPNEADIGVQVIRFMLREFLLCKADAEVLYRASKTQSIDVFLRQSLPSELEDYVKFFEAFGRDDTWHFLRDAVCDYLLSPDDATTVILGAPVATNDEQRRMTVEGWDILYSHFSDVVAWRNVERFCVKFGDLVLVKRLVALHRYSRKPDGQSVWLDPANDVSQECLLAVLQGFIAVTKGYSDPPLIPIEVNNGFTTEKHARCYLAGKMAKSDPLATKLMHEMVKRVARFIVIIYDREPVEGGPRKVIAGNDEADENPWIRRSRCFQTGDSLEHVPWKVEWSLDNILSDLSTFGYVQHDDNMRRYYYKYIIIDRNAGNTFSILEQVADALSQLDDDPSSQQILERAVRSSMPAEQHQPWLEAITLTDSSATHLDICKVHYEGNRVRSWNVVADAPGFLRGVGKTRRSRSDCRIVSSIVADMEARGLVTSLKQFERPRSLPIVLRGDDGLGDIYFDYDLGVMDEGALRRSPFMAPELVLSGDALRDFAAAFKERHPDAVFAKGRIHVHYCAWPMPPLRHGALGLPNFRTVEGHMYRWNVLPFDTPLASRAWQFYLHCKIHSKLPFVRFCQTTFVVCAKEPEDAEANLKTLLAAASEQGWKLSVPPPPLWTTDVDNLDLKRLWAGVPPTARLNRR